METAISGSETAQVVSGHLPGSETGTSHLLDANRPTTPTIAEASEATPSLVENENPISTPDAIVTKDAKSEDEILPDKSLTEKVEALGDALTGIEIKNLSTELLRDVLSDISSRVKSLEVSLKPPQDPGKPENSTGQSVPDPVIKLELDGISGSAPIVNFCNWETFKNCFSKDGIRPAIDVLRVYHNDDLDEQIEEEQIRRLPPDTDPEERESFEKERIRRRHLRHEKRDEVMRLERVRIKSRHVLQFLADVTGETFRTDRPYTFLRPFKFLIHHHQRLENAFHVLEEKLKASLEPKGEVVAATITDTPLDLMSETPTEAEGPGPNKSDLGKNNTTEETLPQENTSADGLPDTSGNVPGVASTKSDEKVVPPVDSSFPDSAQTDKSLLPAKKTITLEEELCSHIKCYMEFARSQLIPTYRKFEKLDHNGNPKICYEELWSLFRPGELVFQRADGDGPDSESANNNNNNNTDSHRLTSQTNKGPRVWRLVFMDDEKIDWGVRNLTWTSDLRGQYSNPDDLEPVGTDSYHLDFNGEQYEPALGVFTFDRWKGKKSITSLPLFPVRFHKDAKKILKEYRERGERFQYLLTQGHLPMEYNGWTLSKNPAGQLIKDWDDSRCRPEYISSDVIIDHQETLQAKPWWRPPFDFNKVREDPNESTHPLETSYDSFPIMVWADATRTKLLGQISEIVIEYENIDQVEYHTLSQTDDFIVDPTARSFEKNTAKKKLSLDDLCLLPDRLFAYSLRDRKFINASIDCLKEITPIPDPWQQLKISSRTMELIRNTVDDHFAKKRLQRELHGMGLEALEQDFIRTKGRGLVFLLHGPPGVGKTATAEAVASAHRKPLFPLACSDLGVDPGTVEERLSGVFRLANQWDCVLLLDEADIFLSHREKKDDNLQRNAIVSTFLRTMEYYPGILFLTTNRVGALDEALTSRVHISLAFGDLNYKQTREIFQMNIDRCRKIAAQRANIQGEPQLIIEEQEILSFATREFDKCEGNPFWNGRVIRNSFHIAMSLAYLEKANDTLAATDKTTASEVQEVKCLGKRHFKKVLKIFQDFKKYREIMFNKSDDKLAQERGDRAAASSLLAASQIGSNHGRAGAYGTPRHSPVVARSSRPSYHKDYSDGQGRDRREPQGGRSRYGPDDDAEGRSRNSRGKFDRDSDSDSESDYCRQPARDRDRSHDYDRERERGDFYRPRSRREYDRTPRKARDDQAGLEIPSDHRPRSNRSPREEAKAGRGQRSMTPSPRPRRKGYQHEDSD